jgi:hypothetical protein
VPCKRKSLLKYAAGLGLTQTEGRKHIKLSDRNGSTYMIPRGNKYKDLEDCYVKDFARVFSLEVDDVWAAL